MINAKLLIGSGAGVAGGMKLWSGETNWHPFLVGIGILIALWFVLVVTFCAMDCYRRQVRSRPLPIRGIHPPQRR